VEIDSTPLGERLSPAARAGILTDCRSALAQWTTPGDLRFPFTSNLVVAHPG
jgi:hypothetical protein